MFCQSRSLAVQSTINTLHVTGSTYAGAYLGEKQCAMPPPPLLTPPFSKKEQN